MVLARRDEPDVVATAATGGNRRPWLVAGVAVAALALAAGVAAPRLPGRHDGAATLRAGTDTAVPILGMPTPAPPTVELQLQPGWQTLFADGDKLVVGTRPLVSRDLLLAVLARDDVAFSAFPADGAVLVVGGDRLKAKYVGDPSKATRTTTAAGGEVVQLSPDAVIGPGPALDLGPQKPLPGGVVVRLGDVPQSIRTLAAYFGPRADPGLMQEAQAMAATVRLQRMAPGVTPPPPPGPPPPPPPGSRPGFDSGQAPGSQAREVVSFTLPGTTYTGRADGDCADVALAGATQPLAGGCSAGRPTGSAVEVVAVSANSGSPPSPPQGQAFAPGKGPVLPATIVLARLGPEARSVVAVLVDGRTIPAAVGGDGWALVATGGRPFLLEVRGRGGKPVAQTPVA